MSVYAVILNKPNETVWGRLKSEYEKSYLVSDTVAFVSPESPTALTSQIAEILGIGEKNGITGVVCEVANHNGNREWKRTVESRLTAIETELRHVATKADLEAKFSSLLKWMIGVLVTVLAAGMATAFALSRFLSFGPPGV